MLSLSNLLLCSAILLGSTHAASLATEDHADNNCTVSDAFKAFSCLFRFTDFLEKLSELNKDDKQSIAEFKKTCDSLQSCFDSLKCGQKKEEHEKITEKMSTICSAVVYTFDDFGECMQKLEERNSTCFRNWTPLQKMDKSELMDKEKLEKMKKEMCLNVFGKDKCIKKEIIDNCGEEKWEGAKKHFVALVKTSVECDVDEQDEVPEFHKVARRHSFFGLKKNPCKNELCQDK